MPGEFTSPVQIKIWGPQSGRAALGMAASRTKFLPVDHPLIQTARDAGTTFGD